MDILLKVFPLAEELDSETKSELVTLNNTQRLYDQFEREAKQITKERRPPLDMVGDGFCKMVFCCDQVTSIEAGGFDADAKCDDLFAVRQAEVDKLSRVECERADLSVCTELGDDDYASQVPLGGPL